MNEEITMEDIKEAMKHLEENPLPKQRNEYPWGWIESDEHGLPGTIGFNKKTMKILKKLVFEVPKTKKNLKIKKVMGIDVVEDSNE